MIFNDRFTYDLFYEAIMGNIKHKRKSAREPQLSANSRAARKRDKQDVAHLLVMTSDGFHPRMSSSITFSGK